MNAMWLAGLMLSLVFAPIWWLFARYGSMTQGMFAAVPNIILWLYALQFQKYLRKKWFYGVLFSISCFYVILALFLPERLPQNIATSVVLWPFVIISIGIDHLILKKASEYFENAED